MSRGQMAVATAWMVMLLAAAAAAAIIWVTTTDPMFVAALAATGDVVAMVSGLGGRVLESLW